jgi:hypothetical protein
MNRWDPAKPVRVGIFDSLQKAEEAVSKLLEAGFSKEQLAVICSEQAVADHFIAEGLQDEQPANALARAAAGGIIGSVLGGLGFIGLATSSGLGIMAAGALLPAIVSGGIAGSFLGAMTSRGVDKEAADFYDQVVETGKLLVVVEDHSEKANENLRIAEGIFSDSGTIPIPLMDG